jgi:hypothetical protein
MTVDFEMTPHNGPSPQEFKMGKTPTWHARPLDLSAHRKESFARLSATFARLQVEIV